MHTSLRDVRLLVASVHTAQEKEEVGNQLRFECPTLWKAVVPGSVGSPCQTWMDRRRLPAYRPGGVLYDSFWEGSSVILQWDTMTSIWKSDCFMPLHFFRFISLNVKKDSTLILLIPDMWFLEIFDYYPLRGQGITHFTAPTPFMSTAPCQAVLCYKTPMADTLHYLTLNSVPVIPS